jgi:DNA modification methylase
MTDLRIETVNINSLTPDPANARKHDGKNLQAIENSLLKFGQRKPICVTPDSIVVAGNGTLEAAKSLGWTEIVIARTPVGWTWEQIRAFALADNRTAELAEWDDKVLADQLLELDANGWELEELGFENLEPPAFPELLEEDEIPSAPLDPISKIGDVWQLGEHRVMCGDSTNMEHVAKLTNGNKAVLLHADPPYGMGKEKDGVENDNLYAEKLDAFQMLWWKTWRKHLQDNASAYIWGNALDLWRLWWIGALSKTEFLELRNEIVWDKKAVPGMKSNLLTQFPMATERCLFFQIGQQFLGNVNSEDFPESWEPLRSYMENEAQAVGLNSKELQRITGTMMFSHWFTKSQFNLIGEKYYQQLQNEYPSNFQKPWKELKSEWDNVKGGPNSEIQGARSYFDNGHDIMRDVWEAPRVFGEDRHGHATPKPLELMQRVMKSSAPEKGLVFEPFGGSGSTLIGAEQTGRICYTMELTPAYVDVIVKRWENLTGKTAELLGQ